MLEGQAAFCRSRISSKTEIKTADSRHMSHNFEDNGDEAVIPGILVERVCPLLKLLIYDLPHQLQANNETDKALNFFFFFFFSIQFSLFPAHINISYSNNNVYILCRKRGGQKTMLMDIKLLQRSSAIYS